MNKTFFILVLFLFSSLFAFSDEKTAVWDRIYHNAINDEMRYAVLVNIRELHDPSFSDLLSQALKDVSARNIEIGADTNEIESKVALATIIIQELGALKDNSNADLVYQVYKDTDRNKHPILKAEAAMALGKMKASDYVAQLSKALEDLNNMPGRDNQAAQEITAFGLVQSLGMLKDAHGYEPVFFASIGWYSPVRKVKETAKTVMGTMIDDPSDYLTKIIKSQNDYAKKLYGLEAEDLSKAPDSQKAKVALAALEDGVRIVPNNVIEASQLSTLRKKAMSILLNTRDKTPEAVALYQDQYKTALLANETNEVLTLIQLQGVNGTPEAAKFLSSILANYNERFSKGLLIEDFQIQQIRVVLQAMKESKNPLVRPSLIEAQFLYTPALQRDIKATLASIPQN